jgi:hypothetical protein
MSVSVGCYAWNNMCIMVVKPNSMYVYWWNEWSNMLMLSLKNIMILCMVVMAKWVKFVLMLWKLCTYVLELDWLLNEWI